MGAEMLFPFPDGNLLYFNNELFSSCTMQIKIAYFHKTESKEHYRLIEILEQGIVSILTEINDFYLFFINFDR